jgi:hypothetical protein
MTPRLELLLTVFALSEERYAGPLSHAIPKRLQSALRTARKNEEVYVDEAGVYLEEAGSAALIAADLNRPFTQACRALARRQSH